jgi:hypothetical protein
MFENRDIYSRQINCQNAAGLSKLITRGRAFAVIIRKPFCKIIDRDFESSIARQRRLTISDIALRQTLNHQSFQGFSLV